MSTDDEVVSRAKDGDPAAWRELYLAHAGRLLLWLRTVPLGDAATSPDDTAADAWLVAARRIDTFHGSAQEFAGWLFGIARKSAANSRRRGWRRDTRPTDREPAGDVPVGDVLEDRIAGEDWVRRVLASLPRRERQVLGCMEVVGLDTAATAQALGISEGAVRLARHRGLHRLRATSLATETTPATVPTGAPPAVRRAPLIS